MIASLPILAESLRKRNSNLLCSGKDQFSTRERLQYLAIGFIKTSLVIRHMQKTSWNYRGNSAGTFFRCPVEQRLRRLVHNKMPHQFRNDLEWHELVQAAVLQEPQSLDRLLTACSGEVKRVLQVRWPSALSRRLDLSDAVQETQIEITTRLADYWARKPMPFRLWLHRTAIERLVKLRRRHLDAGQRAVAREAMMPDRTTQQLMNCLVARQRGPVDEAMHRENLGRVREALDTLADIDREILLMRFVEELTYEEIGCVLELTADAVRKRQGRVLLRLSGLLTE